MVGRAWGSAAGLGEAAKELTPLRSFGSRFLEASTMTPFTVLSVWATIQREIGWSGESRFRRLG